MSYENADQLPEGVIEVYTQGNLEAVTIGKPYNGRWLYSSPDELVDPNSLELTKERQEGRAHLLEVIVPFAERVGVSELAVPRVDRFNARIANISSLPHDHAEILSGDIKLLRGEQEDYFNDGFVLQSGEGAIIVTGDCHTIAFYSEDPNEPVVAVHAGRNSLHQINHIHTTGSDSVVFEALGHFVDPRIVHAHIIAGIGPKEFTHPQDHPQYNEHTQDMLEYFAKLTAANPSDHEGHIDLVTAIQEQLLSKNVPKESITHDKLNTFTNERLWSNRQGEKQRNTILVLNKNH